MKQLQFQGNMKSDCQEKCILNPLLGSDEIANVGNLCQNSFMILMVHRYEAHFACYVELQLTALRHLGRQ
jgi:hypothetical protein